MEGSEINQFIADHTAAVAQQSWFERHYTNLRQAIFKVMIHGVKYDLEAARAKAIELDQRKVAIKEELLVVTNSVKLWSEKSHRSEELEQLYESQRRAKEIYTQLPKTDRAARKSYRDGTLKPIADAIKDCRDSGRGTDIEVGTGLSGDKICEYLYTILGIPTYKKRRKESGKVTPTADDITLKKIRLKYPQHTKLIQLILEHRKAEKLMGYLNEDRVDKDGRIRCQYKPFGTQSGRLSSSENPMGTGSNLQNQDRSLKTLMLPDEG